MSSRTPFAVVAKIKSMKVAVETAQHHLVLRRNAPHGPARLGHRAVADQAQAPYHGATGGTCGKQRGVRIEVLAMLNNKNNSAGCSAKGVYIRPDCERRLLLSAGLNPT